MSRMSTLMSEHQAEASMSRSSCRNTFALSVATLLLSACATVPETIIQRPLSATPNPPAISAAQNGSIFQATNYRPMFEDRRARMVGDLLTIVINESTAAGKEGTGSGSKTGSATASVPKLFGIPATTTDKFGVTAASGVKFEDKGAASNSNSFSGTIAVTVIEVLANGNLVVAGEKQIAMDKGAEYIRFSGVVNPDNINANTVSSLQVADARAEYRSSARFDAADAMTQMARFFLSVLPF